MSTHFFEITLQNDDAAFDSRDEIEDPLDEALLSAGVGEVTGGGSGMGMCNIDVDATDFDGALNIIRQTLRQLQVSSHTKINYYNESDGTRAVYRVYD